MGKSTAGGKTSAKSKPATVAGKKGPAKSVATPVPPDPAPPATKPAPAKVSTSKPPVKAKKPTHITINSCRNKQLWYSNHIGETFEIHSASKKGYQVFSDSTPEKN